MMIEDGGIRTP